MKKTDLSIFRKNLGLLKDHLQKNQQVKSLVDMAEKLDSNRNSLRWYISGKQEPSVSFLKKLSSTFDVSMDWLIENIGPMIRDKGIDDTYKILVGSFETQRSIIFIKLKYFQKEEQELEQLMATLSSFDLPEVKRIKLESRCSGQILNMQRNRQKLELSQDIMIDNDKVVIRKELLDKHKNDIKKQIKDISIRINRFSLGKSIEFQSTKDEILENN